MPQLDHFSSPCEGPRQGAYPAKRAEATGLIRGEVELLPENLRFPSRRSFSAAPGSEDDFKNGRAVLSTPHATTRLCGRYLLAESFRLRDRTPTLLSWRLHERFRFIHEGSSNRGSRFVFVSPPK